MGLIDVDEALKQLEVRERWQPKNEICVKNARGENCAPVESLKEFIRNRPIIDAVPVVRCKDCKHRDPEDKKCDHMFGCNCPIPRRDDDFCSYGEQRTEATEE